MATSSSSSISEKDISVSYQNSIMDAYKPIENTDTFFTNNVYIPENCEEEKILKYNNQNIKDVRCHLVNETFINTIKEGFELFDSTFKDLFLQQFKILDKKLTTNEIKLFIGSTADKPNPGMYGDALYQLDGVKGIYVNFSEKIVREQMGKPIFFVQQKDNSIPEIKAIPLKDFVGHDETDEHRLLAKCAAYLLFHELFHVNTFADCEFCKDAYKSNVQNFNSVVDGISADDLKKLFLNGNWGDDARNTLCKSNAVPGECDFINKLYPDIPTMRLYYGKGLNFYDSAIRDNCLSVFNSVFREELAGKTLTPTTDQLKADAQGLCENLILQKMRLCYYQVFYKDNHVLKDKVETENKIQKTEEIIKSLNTININKEDFIQFKDKLGKLVELMDPLLKKSWGLNLKTKIYNFLEVEDENTNRNSLKKQIEITKDLVKDFKNFQESGNLNSEDQEKILKILNADIALLEEFLKSTKIPVTESNEVIKICVNINAAHAQQQMPKLTPKPSRGCIIC